MCVCVCVPGIHVCKCVSMCIYVCVSVVCVFYSFAIALMAHPATTLAPPLHAAPRPLACRLPPSRHHLGLRGGNNSSTTCLNVADDPAQLAAAQPVSLWTSLFAMAFAGTLATAQLASKDLIPGRSVLKYKVVAKERLPDAVRGGNATALRLVVSTIPTTPQQISPSSASMLYAKVRV